MLGEGAITTAESSALREWAIVHILGYTTIAGILDEVELFGTKMGRVTVPVGNSWKVTLFGAQSVHHIDLVSEEEARKEARLSHPAEDDDDSEIPF